MPQFQSRRSAGVEDGQLVKCRDLFGRRLNRKLKGMRSSRMISMGFHLPALITVLRQSHRYAALTYPEDTKRQLKEEESSEVI